MAPAKSGKSSLPAWLLLLPILRGGFWEGPFRALSPGTFYLEQQRGAPLWAGIPQPSLRPGKAPKLDPLQQKDLKIAILTADAEKDLNMRPLNLPAAEDGTEPPAPSHAWQTPCGLYDPKSSPSDTHPHTL